MKGAEESIGTNRKGYEADFVASEEQAATNRLTLVEITNRLQLTWCETDGVN